MVAPEETERAAKAGRGCLAIMPGEGAAPDSTHLCRFALRRLQLQPLGVLEPKGEGMPDVLQMAQMCQSAENVKGWRTKGA